MKTQLILIRGGETYDSYEGYLAGLKSMPIDLERFTKKGWKEKLAEDLGASVNVIVPSMPNSLNAKYVEWKIYFEKLLPLLDNEFILVGNSLGSIFLAKYLSENTVSKKILGVFLVGAPYDAADSEYTLADFILPKSLKNMKEQCSNIFFYYSSDDPVIPREDMGKYQKALPEATYALLDNRGHFNVPEFPELIKDIKSVLN